MSTDDAPDIVRFTVALLVPINTMLEELAEREDMSRTDVMNRAIRLYYFVDAGMADGGELLIRRPDGEEKVIHL